MRILVTGAKGQLGHDLVQMLISDNAGHDVLPCGREELDVRDAEAAYDLVNQTKPDVIVHTAAYTAVDRAEDDIDEAFSVNAYGTRNVAVVGESVGAKICYVSTDYVFDGESDRPYREFDPTSPSTIYGQSKLAGEIMIQSMSSRYFIVRTSWVYGKHGNNFVKTMLKLGQECSALKVVNDQIGSPTYTKDLARFIGELILTDKYGKYHASNTGSCSWYEFAKTIFEEAHIQVEVDPCTTADFPRQAPRPKNSVLDHLSIRTNGFDDLPPWRDALKRFLAEER